MTSRIKDLFILLLLPISAYSQTTTATCQYPQIFKALKANVENGSDIFCQELLASVSLVGTLREDPTLYYSTTVTNRKSTDVVYAFTSTTTHEVVTSTTYAAQYRQAQNFTTPLPSYVQQYPTPRVSKACSCLIGSGPTYTQYRVCEQATTTTTYSTTFTYTVGKPGTSTSTYTNTITKTNLKHTTVPFPTTCPNADGIDYIATDHSIWQRGCNTAISCGRDLGTVKTPTFVGCIENCVAYNQKSGYKQCQAVAYNPQNNECSRINEPCYFEHDFGDANVALLRFFEPTTTNTNYCSTVSGAAF